MADYISNYTGAEIDAGIAKANTAIQPVEGKGLSTNDYTDADKTKLNGIDMSTKQDTLVSGTNIKTINGNSVLGGGNITISGGGSGGIGFSCWENKTAVCVGDSITAGSGTTKIYYNILNELLSFTSVQGMGVAGSCVSATSNYGTSNSPLIHRYQNIPDKDLITIFMGTNDYGHNTPMGTIADTTDISFYGALNVIIPGILTAHPNSRLVWITPTHRDGFGSGFTHDWVANGAGKTLEDYVNAIKDVCARYSVPVIDLFSISGLNPVIAGIKSTYMPDGLHPNALGHQKMAVYMAKYLNLYSEFLPEEGQVISVTGVSLNNSTLTLQTGTQGSLVASISPANSTNKNVTWEITSGSNLCTITPNGLNCSITAGNTAGEAIVRVKTEDGNYTASCTITITSSSIPVTGVELSGIDIINVGASSTLTATISPSNATNKNVTWTITSGSEYVTLTPNGTTCTIEGIAEGSADITVTTQDGNFSDTMTVTVQPAPVLGWELDYGNRYSANTADWTSHGRLSPKSNNRYFEAGTVLTLIDNVSYKWNVTPQGNEDSFNTASWMIPEGWVTTQTCTIPSSGYYGFAILKADGTNFDLTTDSDNAFDYISVS